MHHAAYLAGICLAACIPSTASASLPTDRPATTARAMESLRIAADFWDQPVADLRLYLATSDELYAMSDLRGTAAYTIGHSIWIDEWLMGRRAYDDRISACNAIVHEVGHALAAPIGFPNPVDPIHSLASSSVMRQLQPEWKVVYGCYKRFLPRGKARAWRSLMGHRPFWLTR